MHYKTFIVFPARAGMSRGRGVLPPPPVGVPRASGDEPTSCITSQTTGMCSPRERG